MTPGSGEWPTPEQEAELARIAAEPGGHTSREVFEYLLSITDDADSQALLRSHIEVFKARDARASH